MEFAKTRLGREGETLRWEWRSALRYATCVAAGLIKVLATDPL